jgi:hypothetical protein
VIVDEIATCNGGHIMSNFVKMITLLKGGPTILTGQGLIATRSERSSALAPLTRSSKWRPLYHGHERCHERSEQKDRAAIRVSSTGLGIPSRSSDLQPRLDILSWKVYLAIPREIQLLHVGQEAKYA